MITSPVGALDCCYIWNHLFLTCWFNFATFCVYLKTLSKFLWFMACKIHWTGRCCPPPPKPRPPDIWSQTDTRKYARRARALLEASHKNARHLNQSSIFYGFSKTIHIWNHQAESTSPSRNACGLHSMEGPRSHWIELLGIQLLVILASQSNPRVLNHWTPCSPVTGKRACNPHRHRRSTYCLAMSCPMVNMCKYQPICVLIKAWIQGHHGSFMLFQY